MASVVKYAIKLVISHYGQNIVIDRLMIGIGIFIKKTPVNVFIE